MNKSYCKKIFALLFVFVFVFTFSATVLAQSYIIDGNIAHIAGDANSDKAVDVMDITYLKARGVYNKSCDINGNGEIDSYDRALMRAQVMGVDKSLWTE